MLVGGYVGWGGGVKEIEVGSVCRVKYKARWWVLVGAWPLVTSRGCTTLVVHSYAHICQHELSISPSYIISSLLKSYQHFSMRALHNL